METLQPTKSTNLSDQMSNLRERWFAHLKELEGKHPQYVTHNGHSLEQQLISILTQKMEKGDELEPEYQVMLLAFKELFSYKIQYALDYDVEVEVSSDVTVFFDDFQQVKRILNAEEIYTPTNEEIDEQLNLEDYYIGNSCLSSHSYAEIVIKDFKPHNLTKVGVWSEEGGAN